MTKGKDKRPGASLSRAPTLVVETDTDPVPTKTEEEGARASPPNTIAPESDHESGTCKADEECSPASPSTTTLAFRYSTTR